MTMEYRELEALIVKWGSDRQILTHGTPIGQAMKTKEEAHELYAAAVAQDLEAAADAIGDTLVTLIMAARLLGLDVLDCLAGAYDQIKDRKGRMGPDGIFHKEP